MSETREMTEKRIVRDLDIGFGRTMQLAEECWREMLEEKGMAGGEHTTGPCAVFMVPCPHLVVKSNKKWLDANGHCDWCCGCGRVTKKVAHAMRAVKP